MKYDENAASKYELNSVDILQIGFPFYTQENPYLVQIFCVQNCRLDSGSPSCSSTTYSQSETSLQNLLSCI